MRKASKRRGLRVAASDGTVLLPRGDVKLVTSAHLVSERSPESSELEFGLISCYHAFGRWAMRCMAAAGLPDLAVLDVLVLHHVNHRNRAKKLADICFVLNVEDTHTVAYSLKKLVAAGAVQGERVGKEVFYSTTDKGKDFAQRYRDIREACLVNALVNAAGATNEEIGHAASVLRAMSGLYDQAARAASSL